MTWLGGERIGTIGASATGLGKTVSAALAVVCLCSSVARASARGVAPHGRDASPQVSAAATVRDPAPEPYFGPDDVVGIMLHALQHNDDPVTDHGIAVTFAFTSPENHDVTGPLRRFRTIVKSSAYRPMLGHAHADRGPVTFVAEHARQRVAITGAHGEHAVYVFLLSRQESGVYKGCWMADGVLRESDPLLDPIDPPLTRAVVQQD